MRICTSIAISCTPTPQLRLSCGRGCGFQRERGCSDEAGCERRQRRGADANAADAHPRWMYWYGTRAREQGKRMKNGKWEEGRIVRPPYACGRERGAGRAPFTILLWPIDACTHTLSSVLLRSALRWTFPCIPFLGSGPHAAPTCPSLSLVRRPTTPSSDTPIPR
jgi:hypothetical protein